jgi:hypothetical protein
MKILTMLNGKLGTRYFKYIIATTMLGRKIVCKNSMIKSTYESVRAVESKIKKNCLQPKYIKLT